MRTCIDFVELTLATRIVATICYRVGGATLDSLSQSSSRPPRPTFHNISSFCLVTLYLSSRYIESKALQLIALSHSLLTRANYFIVLLLFSDLLQLQ